MSTLGNLAFLCAFVGSFGGWLGDRVGGAKITMYVFFGMAAGIALIMASL
ncbi:hypothetical protein [Nocardia sp. CNY236]|nr:hypothetical protein [Nocardia sp. CNY236]